MENFCLQWDSILVPFAYEARAIRDDKYRSPKCDRILPECAINNYQYLVVDLVKCFVM